MNNKLINEALKDIWSLEEPAHQKEIAIYWLKRMFREGRIDALEWAIKNNEKHTNLFQR